MTTTKFSTIKDATNMIAATDFRNVIAYTILYECENGTEYWTVKRKVVQHNTMGKTRWVWL